MELGTIGRWPLFGRLATPIGDRIVMTCPGWLAIPPAVRPPAVADSAGELIMFDVQAGWMPGDALPDPGPPRPIAVLDESEWEASALRDDPTVRLERYGRVVSVYRDPVEMSKAGSRRRAGP